MTETATVEELGALLVEQSPDAIIYADRAGDIRTWNAAAVKMFGFAAADAIGKNLDIIIPEQYREAHWKGFEKALSTGVTKYSGEAMPTKAMKATGDLFYVELSFAIVRDAAGTIIGALAHARDITERFEQDRASRRRLRELEQELKGLREGAAPA